MTLLKFEGQDNGNGRGTVHWGRRSRDGIPMRVNGQVPLLKEEEYEAYSETVKDAKIRTFDMSNPEDQVAYQEIVDKTVNNWFEIYIRRFRWYKPRGEKPHMMVYMEWGEPFMELPPATVQNNSSTVSEVNNGRSPSGRSAAG